MILLVHSMYWPTRLQRLMLQICSFRRVRVRYRVTVYTQPADGVDGTPHPFDCFRWVLWGIYHFTLFIHVIALWYIHWCTVCASILIQGWHSNTEAWPSEVGSLQMVSSFEWFEWLDLAHVHTCSWNKINIASTIFMFMVNYILLMLVFGVN